MKYDHFCPKCEKKMDFRRGSAFFPYSWSSLCLPYFVCIDCHLAYIDKNLVKTFIQSWAKSGFDYRKFSQKTIYGEATQILEGFIRKAGCRIVRFKKQKPPCQ